MLGRRRIKKTIQQFQMLLDEAGAVMAWTAHPDLARERDPDIDQKEPAQPMIVSL